MLLVESVDVGFLNGFSFVLLFVVSLGPKSKKEYMVWMGGATVDTTSNERNEGRWA